MYSSAGYMLLSGKTGLKKISTAEYSHGKKFKNRNPKIISEVYREPNRNANFGSLDLG